MSENRYEVFYFAAHALGAGAWTYATVRAPEEVALAKAEELAARLGLTRIDRINARIKIFLHVPLREKRPDKRIELEFDD